MFRLPANQRLIRRALLMASVAGLVAGTGAGWASVAHAKVVTCLRSAVSVSRGDVARPGRVAHVWAGSDVTYRETVLNRCDLPATNVVVTDTMPTNFSLDMSSINPTAGTFVVNGAQLSWFVGDLPRESQASISYTETTDLPFTVQEDQTLFSTTDDEGGVFTLVGLDVFPAARLKLSNSDGVRRVVSGSPDTYTIVIVNGGPSDVTNASVIDALPVGFTVTGETVSVLGVAFTNFGNGQVEWTGLNLAHGTTATFTLAGNVDPSLAAGSAFVNLASVSLPPGQINLSPRNVFDDDVVTSAP